MPIVEEGTWAWLELGESSFFAAPVPRSVVASVSANRELYLTLANYGSVPVEVATADAYVPVLQPGAPGKRAGRKAVMGRRGRRDWGCPTGGGYPGNRHVAAR